MKKRGKMPKRKTSFWDILAWIAFIVFLVYLLLMVTGVLKSPLIADVIGIGSLGYFAGRQIQKLDRLVDDFEDVKDEFGQHKQNFRNI